MSRSRIKLILMIALIFFAPALAQAKTLQFKNKTWQIEAELIRSDTEPFVRNDFTLLSLSKNTLIGLPQQQSAKIFSPDTITQIEDLYNSVSQKALDAKMIIENDKATEFEPGQNGQSLDLFQLRIMLESNVNELQLPIIESSPKIQLSDTNRLGINELISVGESNFAGSTSNRIVNIRVGSLKYNGVIVKPGEEFSFNKNLGDVDAAHGFLPELVIKPQGVIPEFGGGLCQVSTTVFRAAMNAGFPITQRRNHSFAVQYYAPQGTDATIYPGASDLKFINNSSTPMMIRTRIDGSKLYFEFYGTKDDRTVTFEGPTQYDKKSDGSMKATWTRHVTMNGVTSDQTFNSTYLPPALFKHEVVEQPATPNPDSPQPSAQPTSN